MSTRSRTSPRGADTASAPSAPGLTNTRTRLVGTRTGPAAEALVAVVRIGAIASGAIARVWHRIAAVISPLGWIVLALTPLALAAGYGLGIIEGVAAGVVGLLLIVVGLVALLGRTAFRVELELGHLRVAVGDAAEAALVVENPGRRRILSSTAEIPVGDGLAEVAVPPLARGAVFRHTVSVPTRHRGIVRLGPVRAIRADPIGLVRREILWADPVDLIVHPRTVAVPSTSTGLIRDLEGVPTRDLTASDVSFHALREYQPGDDRRYIHWRSTAKTGTYMVRQFEQTRRSHLLIGLSLAAADYADQDEFELAVSVAGSLGVRAIRDGRTVSVVVSERTPEFAKRKVFGVRPLSTVRPERLLDDLAVIETAPTALGIRDVARVTADTLTGVSIAYLVCGSAPSAAELRAASAAYGPDIEVVAVVCDPDRAPGLRRVPGLGLLRVGLLEDLRSALARAAAVA
ncbi:MAG: DUF58 domain-containing protein [Micrococcales bacterium]|nr:DUF58 domain-containing protein [Micrococcales bacterium]